MYVFIWIFFVFELSILEKNFSRENHKKANDQQIYYNSFFCVCVSLSLSFCFLFFCLNQYIFVYFTHTHTSWDIQFVYRIFSNGFYQLAIFYEFCFHSFFFSSDYTHSSKVFIKYVYYLYYGINLNLIMWIQKKRRRKSIERKR